MTKKKPAEPTQIDKFKQAAHELQTDESEEAFDRVLKKVVKAPPTKQESKKNKDE